MPSPGPLPERKGSGDGEGEAREAREVHQLGQARQAERPAAAHREEARPEELVLPLFAAIAAAAALTLAGDGPPSQAGLVPDELLGPYGLLIAALVVVGVLYRSLDGAQKRIVELSAEAGRVPDLIARAERAEKIADVAVAGWREQTDASARAGDSIDTIATKLELRAAAARAAKVRAKP